MNNKHVIIGLIYICLFYFMLHFVFGHANKYIDIEDGIKILFAYILIPVVIPLFWKRSATGEGVSKKRGIVILTLIYLLLCPLFFMLAVLSPLGFGSIRMSAFRMEFIMCLFFSIPLSFTVSICLMWLNINNPQLVRSVALIPLFVFILTLIVSG